MLLIQDYRPSFKVSEEAERKRKEKIEDYENEEVYDDDSYDYHDDYNYDQWMQDEFGDDAETAYWNMD